MINLENPVEHRREQDGTCINFRSHGDVVGAFWL